MFLQVYYEKSDAGDLDQKTFSGNPVWPQELRWWGVYANRYSRSEDRGELLQRVRDDGVLVSRLRPRCCLLLCQAELG